MTGVVVMRAKWMALGGLAAVLLAAPVMAADAPPNGTYPVAAQSASIVKVTVNGQAVTADVPAVILDGRTLLPVRAVADALGATVAWDQTTYTASLTANVPPDVATYANLLGLDLDRIGKDLSAANCTDLASAQSDLLKVAPLENASGAESIVVGLLDSSATECTLRAKGDAADLSAATQIDAMVQYLMPSARAQVKALAGQ